MEKKVVVDASNTKTPTANHLFNVNDIWRKFSEKQAQLRYHLVFHLCCQTTQDI